MAPPVASAPDYVSHDVNDLTSDLGQLDQEQQGEDQQSEHHTPVENHAPAPQVEGGNERLSGSGTTRQVLRVESGAPLDAAWDTWEKGVGTIVDGCLLQHVL